MSISETIVILAIISLFALVVVGVYKLIVKGFL